MKQQRRLERRLRNGTNRYASAQGWQRHQLQEGWSARSGPTARPEPAYPDIEDALLLAAQTAGGDGPDGLHNYLAKQAKANPTAFMAMLSKVIPLQQSGSGDGKIIVEIVKHFPDDEPVTLIEHGPTGGDKGEFPNG